jgi:hypothetical protein
MVMITIQIDGDTWRIIGEGATRDGKTYCHLASTTRFRQQRNGRVPVQMADWVDHAVILAAAQQAEEAQRRSAVDQYYRDRASSNMSPLEAHR